MVSVVEGIRRWELIISELQATRKRLINISTLDTNLREQIYMHVIHINFENSLPFFGAALVVITVYNDDHNSGYSIQTVQKKPNLKLPNTNILSLCQYLLCISNILQLPFAGAL